MAAPEPLVSIVIPLHNAAGTLLSTLDSVAQQSHGALEVCVCDDGSTDGSVALLQSWSASHLHIPVRLYPQRRRAALGPSYARNRAASLARGAYLCFLDADDVALPCRVALQLQAARAHPGAIIGASFVREPADATPRYAAWANALTDAQLVHQSWRECTLIQPTWFMERAHFVRLGGYDEVGPTLWGEAPPPYAWPCLALDPALPASGGDAGGTPPPAPPPSASQHAPILARAPLKLRPDSLAGLRGAPPLPPAFTPFPEDPLFFHRHLAAAAAAGTATPLHPVPTPCLTYRYSSTSLSWRVSRAVLLAAKAALFEERLMAPRGAALQWWVWGAGRDGKAFFKALSPHGRALCAGFLDLDPGKIGQRYPPAVGRRQERKRAREAEGEEGGRGGAEGGATPPQALSLPICHFTSLGEGCGSECQVAVAVCVAMDSGGQELCDNVAAASAALVARGGAALVEGVNLFFLC